MFHFKVKQKNKQKGFTLIEMLVSITLFTIIMTVALGSLLVVLDANRKAKSIKLVVNNLSLVLEAMSRELRVGYNYCIEDSPSTKADCNQQTARYTNWSSQDQHIYFKTKDGNHGEFYLKKNPSSSTPNEYGSVMRLLCPGATDCGATNAQQMTGEDVKITGLHFIIRGAESGENIQPSVAIIMEGKMNVADIETGFFIQTLISQRKLAP